MKIITLNIRQGGGSRVPQIVDYLRSHDPDVVVLTEFRANTNAHIFRSKLAAQGLEHVFAASRSPRENSIGIFSKRPFVPHTYPALAVSDQQRLVSTHFGELAVFGVYFAKIQAKASLFQFLLSGGYKPVKTAHFFLGDFNTGLHELDETGRNFYCVKQFEALPSVGLVDSWRSRNPVERTFSWYSQAGNGFRIDHVFASPEADSRIHRVYYDHTPRESHITDHSALVVEYAG